MDPQGSNNFQKKGKQTMTQDPDEVCKETKREANWSVAETTVLLNAVQQIVDRRGKPGFSFTSAEKLDIFRTFKLSLPNTTRDKKKIINRLKVLLQMWKVCNQLANLSGGGWDDDLQRPIAPSETEYVEMIRSKGKAAKFLLTKNFSWFHQMKSMVGGQAARGQTQDHSFQPEQPIEVMMNSQMSILGSEQDSSDDPEDGMNNVRTERTVQPPFHGAGTSNTRGGQSSDGTFPTTRNSGSKRKSTDDSSESDSRGKRYKERLRKKQSDGRAIAEAGFEIAKSISNETKRRERKDETYVKCLEKFEELGIVRKYLNFCIKECKNDMFRRMWILRNDKQTIIEWIEENIGPSSQPPNSSSTNTAPNQSFHQPAPSAFTFASMYPRPF